MDGSEKKLNSKFELDFSINVLGSSSGTDWVKRHDKPNEHVVNLCFVLVLQSSYSLTTQILSKMSNLNNNSCAL